MFRRLTNANKNGQSHELLIEYHSCDVTHDWPDNTVQSGQSHEYQLCPSLMTSEGVMLEET
jgi:hypothetical protein